MEELEGMLESVNRQALVMGGNRELCDERREIRKEINEIEEISDLAVAHPLRKSKALAQANIGIADAIEGLAKANNPHVVKVREALQELECRIAVTISGSSE
tara:strand:+ start:1513 stop:1818 length:306 start_codon:yes stop_codon:yes gene_type:complete